MKTVLITGSTGFIGHFLVREYLKDHKVICLIRPGTTNMARLEDIKDQLTFIEHDLKQNYDSIIDQIKDVNIILHCGGNPSSQDSLNNPVAVVEDNVIGTVQLLEAARKLQLERFFFYGAGEVFGNIAKGTDSLETDPYNSISPYAASKAGAEELCVAYSHAFGIPVSITHIANTFGQRSQANRLPVIAIRKILNDEPLTIHVGSDGNIGGRRWFHAANVALHTRFIIENQKTLCEKWNSAGERYISNLEFAKMIASILGKKLQYNLEPITRQGHDPYISNTPSKIYAAGWAEPISMLDRLKETVEWYKANPEWLTRE